MSVSRKRSCECGATWEGLKTSECPRCSSLAAPALLAAEEAEKSAWWQLEKLTEQAQAANKRLQDARNKWALAYGALKSAQRKAANEKGQR